MQIFMFSDPSKIWPIKSCCYLIFENCVYNPKEKKREKIWFIFKQEFVKNYKKRLSKFQRGPV